jgi:uncharacterized protein
MTPTEQARGAVTVLITRRVTPGHEAAFEQASNDMTAAARSFPGYLGGQLVRQVSGLGHWFAALTGPRQSPPPRWKVAVVTWLGICPTVYALFLLLGELLAPWPLLPRVMLLTALVVITMTWLVAPQLTKWLKPWLYPATPVAPSA